jgi:hypothetical protein
MRLLSHLQKSAMGEKMSSEGNAELSSAKKQAQELELAHTTHHALSPTVCAIRTGIDEAAGNIK